MSGVYIGAGWSRKPDSLVGERVWLVRLGAGAVCAQSVLPLQNIKESGCVLL